LSFVPTQVARNQAPRDQQQAHQSSTPSSRDKSVLNGQQNRQQQPRVTLPAAILKVINPPESEVSQATTSSGGNQQSRPHKQGKSRIAANFGNNLS